MTIVSGHPEWRLKHEDAVSKDVSGVIRPVTFSPPQSSIQIDSTLLRQFTQTDRRVNFACNLNMYRTRY